MSATPSQTLIDEGKCYACLPVSLAETAALVLWDGISQNISPVPPVVPNAPEVSDLDIVDSGTDGTAIVYSFDDSIPNVLYNGYVSTVGIGGPWTLTGTNINSGFEVTGLTPNQNYWFKVTSRGNGVVYSTTEVDSNLVAFAPFTLDNVFILSSSSTSPFDVYEPNPSGVIEHPGEGWVYASALNCDGITLLNLAYNSFTSLDISGCTALTSLLLSGTPVTTLTINGGIPALTQIDLSGTNLATMSFIDSQNYGAINDFNCDSSLVDYLDLEGNQIVDTINIDNCVNLLNVFVSDNPLNEATVDYILQTLDGLGLLNGNCQLGGTGPAPPGPAGAAAALSLQGKGWGVTTN